MSGSWVQIPVSAPIKIMSIEIRDKNRYKELIENKKTLENDCKVILNFFLELRKENNGFNPYNLPWGNELVGIYVTPTHIVFRFSEIEKEYDGWDGYNYSAIINDCRMPVDYLWENYKEKALIELDKFKEEGRKEQENRQKALERQKKKKEKDEKERKRKQLEKKLKEAEKLKKELGISD